MYLAIAALQLHAFTWNLPWLFHLWSSIWCFSQNGNPREKNEYCDYFSLSRGNYLSFVYVWLEEHVLNISCKSDIVTSHDIIWCHFPAQLASLRNNIEKYEKLFVMIKRFKKKYRILTRFDCAWIVIVGSSDPVWFMWRSTLRVRIPPRAARGSKRKKVKSRGSGKGGMWVCKERLASVLWVKKTTHCRLLFHS